MAKLNKFVFYVLTIVFSHYSGYSQVNKANWFERISSAKEFSVKNEVPILMVFAGSDWCKPCIQFKRDILTSEQFSLFAAENLAILYLDFPRKKINKLSDDQTAHNEKLADVYNPSGVFPKILLLNSDGSIISELTFNNEIPGTFIENCKKVL